MKVFIFTMVARPEFPNINPYYAVLVTAKNLDAARETKEYKYVSQYYNSLIYAQMDWWRYLAVLLPWYHRIDKIV